MKQQNFVLFADEKRNQSLTKVAIFTAIGSLVFQQDFLEFKGRKLSFQISNIKQISIARQQVPWVSLLITSIIVLIGFGVIVRDRLGALFLLLPIILLGNAFAFVVSYSTKWVRIEYIDAENKTCSAFFADGSFFGWRGLFGGTEKLHQAIKSTFAEIANG
jgi:hypothetical protein